MALIFAALAAPAYALDGGGMLASEEKLKVKDCGKDNLETAIVFELFPDNTWTAITDDPIEYSGTYTDNGKGKLEMSFDAESLETLNAVLVERASILCGGPVEVTSTVEKKFKGKVKKGKAKIKIKFEFTGTGGGEAGKAKWQLKAKGTFTEAAQ
jgi:hypothetical protein